MRTGPIALALLLCSGTVLAQNPLGDDSGPNANDGQCDDTRFENIGAGNSNIVFWEGGRYDGRDATDCRNLLLQGLINWRDGVDPRVDVVLATGDFGDDSGPNANNGECDDTRFENIGAGNSNIVFWEGGRYDGRDATDCADLLLQGLIAWQRDGAVAGVAAEPATSTVADARQQQSTALPEGVTAESICSVNLEAQACWMELDNMPGCYVWNPDPVPNATAVWSGQCANGLGTGTVVYEYSSDQGSPSSEIPYINGEIHGTVVSRSWNGNVFETPWVNGERHGTAVRRSWTGTVLETPWVNGEIHGMQVDRRADGTVVRETPWVSGERHGTEVSRYSHASVVETPYVHGQRHGTRVERWWNVIVLETPYVNDERHGTETRHDPDGSVIEYNCFRSDVEISNEPCQDAANRA